MSEEQRDKEVTDWLSVLHIKEGKQGLLHLHTLLFWAGLERCPACNYKLEKIEEEWKKK